MKTMKMSMVCLFLVLGLFWITPDSNSQDVKLSRQERKEVRKAEMAENFVILDSLLSVKRFVLEADYLQDKYGNIKPVLSTLNFIKVNGTSGILQTGSSSGFGSNDVGGATAEGSIGEWNVTKYVKSGQVADDQSVTQNTYEYNDKGYPVSLNGNVKYV